MKNLVLSTIIETKKVKNVLYLLIAQTVKIIENLIQ